MLRILFVSPHCYIDPSSGAALATRDVLEGLVARGWDCRALTCGLLDFAHETPIDDLLASKGFEYQRRQAVLPNTWTTDIIDMTVEGVRVAIVPTSSSRAERAPAKPRDSST